MRDSAETAFAEASPVGGQGKTNGLQGGHRTRFGIVGVDVVAIGQFINGIDLSGGRGKLSRVVHQVAGVLTLVEPFAAPGIGVVVKEPEHAGKAVFVGRHGCMIGQFHIRSREYPVDRRRGITDVAQSADTGRVLAMFQSVARARTLASAIP